MDEQIIARRDYKIKGIVWHIRKEDGFPFYSLVIDVNEQELQYMMEENELDHLILEMRNVKNNIGYVN